MAQKVEEREYFLYNKELNGKCISNSKSKNCDYTRLYLFCCFCILPNGKIIISSFSRISLVSMLNHYAKAIRCSFPAFFIVQLPLTEYWTRVYHFSYNFRWQISLEFLHEPILFTVSFFCLFLFRGIFLLSFSLFHVVVFCCLIVLYTFSYFL